MSKKLYFPAFIALFLAFAVPLAAAEYGSENITPAQSLLELKKGNMRFFGDRSIHPRLDRKQRLKTQPALYPKALIISCADARVPVEALFDQGIGDLMVVRVPGNTATGKDVQAGLWYSVNRLKVPLVVVLGHSNCEAINTIWDESVPELLPSVAEAVRQIKRENNASDAQEHILKHKAVIRNVENSIEFILNTFPEFLELITNDQLRIVGAVYMLDSGRVDWLDY